MLTAPAGEGDSWELRAAARAWQGSGHPGGRRGSPSPSWKGSEASRGSMVALLLGSPPPGGHSFRTPVPCQRRRRRNWPWPRVPPSARLHCPGRRELLGLRWSAVAYDRRTREIVKNRVAFTGRILRAGWSPAVRQFPDQWFHFVPVWKPGDPSEHSGHS